jgi:Holliday junction resolvase RusA-like endonuclease
MNNYGGIFMKWSFVVEVDNWNNVRDIVEKKCKEVAFNLGKHDNEKSIYKVIATFYQKKSRWLMNDSSIPRQDWGIDLDNMLKPVFDGLGPIIGYRIDWQGSKKNPGVLDSNIVEVYAKKVNSGSEKEFIGVEIELLHTSKLI